MGRPSIFSEEIAGAILQGLSEGKSLQAVCREDGMPSAGTVMAWLDDERRAAFSERYAAVRARAYLLLADEIIDISDDSKGDTYVDADGVERTDQERVARAKLRVDSRKWMLSKMLPKVYGDKLDLNHSGEIGVRQIERRIVDSVSPDDTSQN